MVADEETTILVKHITSLDNRGIVFRKTRFMSLFVCDYKLALGDTKRLSNYKFQKLKTSE